MAGSLLQPGALGYNRAMAMNNQDKQQRVLRVLVITLFLNLLIAFSKLIYGYMSGALSMMADGFHSAMDSASNVVGIIAVRYAFQPPDADHHYGHRKAEVLASMGIGVLLALTCIEVVKELVERIVHPQAPTISLWAFVIMLVGLAVNGIVVKYEASQGQQLGSPILLSDAEHTRSDVLVTLSVLASLTAIAFRLYWIDILVSLVIVVFIARISYTILKKNLQILMDLAPIETEQVLQIVQQMEGVINCHKIRAHGIPGDIYIDLHIWVEPDMTVTEAHQLAHATKDRLRTEFDGITDVTIHVEPAS